MSRGARKDVNNTNNNNNAETIQEITVSLMIQERRQQQRRDGNISSSGDDLRRPLHLLQFQRSPWLLSIPNSSSSFSFLLAAAASHKMDTDDQRDWSQLCEELTGKIAKQLPSLEDFLRFGMVCQSWRSVTVQKLYYPISLEFSADEVVGNDCLPWLMLRERPAGSEDNDTRDFYSLWKNKVYPVNLPETRGRRCWGSPYGWLITIDLELNIHLLNPLTRVQTCLPPPSTFQDDHCDYRWSSPEDLRQSFVHKVVIAPSTTASSSSSSYQFLAMAIYSYREKLAFARPGDKEWTTLQDASFDGYEHLQDASFGVYEDVICFNGQFYAVTSLGDVHICDVSADLHPPKAAFYAPSPKKVWALVRFYLLDLEGELHMVVRMYDTERTLYRPPGTNTYLTHFFYHTHFFEVYKLDLDTKKWTELLSFDNYALFVGDNTAFSVSTTQHSECNGNCIYFTDDSYEGNTQDFGRDTGIFNFKDEYVMPLSIVRNSASLSSFSTPVWITPNLSW